MYISFVYGINICVIIPFQVQTKQAYICMFRYIRCIVPNSLKLISVVSLKENYKYIFYNSLTYLNKLSSQTVLIRCNFAKSNGSLDK